MVVLKWFVLSFLTNFLSFWYLYSCHIHNVINIRICNAQEGNTNQIIVNGQRTIPRGSNSKRLTDIGEG